MGDSDGQAVSLRVEQVSYRYRGAERLALDDLSFTTEGGTVLGIVGPNGSGKTTLFRLLLGFARPDSGNIYVDGQEAASHRRHHGVGYLPEAVVLPPDVSAMRLATFAASLVGFGRVEAAEKIRQNVQVLDLGDVMQKRTQHLSHGYRQRVGLLLAMLGDPNLLLLDEPANGLDPYSMGVLRSLLRHLRRRGATVLVSSHNLLELQRVCDQVVLLSQGRLLGKATQEELAASPDIFVVQLQPGSADGDVDARELRRLGGVRFAADEFAFSSQDAARHFADGFPNAERIERRPSDLEYLFHSLLQRSAGSQGSKS